MHKTEKHPRVSVLMSVYNGERFLRDALESILNQTFTDFEFLIIDDGSTDSSRDIILSYKDSRIRLLENRENMGLTKSLILGVAEATGRYIARMDSDDVSLSERLAKQVAFLDSHPEVGICGSWVETIGEPSGHLWRYPIDPAAVKCTLLFENALAHSAVLMRRRIMMENNISYNPVYRRSQDYELWSRLSHVTALANVGEVLVLHRLHPAGVGSRYNDEQVSFADDVRLTQLHNLGISPTKEEIGLHVAISRRRFAVDREFVRSAGMWLANLREANRQKPVYSEPAFSRVLGDRWLAVCTAAEDLGIWVVNRYWQSPLSYPNSSFGRKMLSAVISLARRKVILCE